MSYRQIAALVLCSLAFSSVHADGVNSENLDEYGKGIITDYSNMSESESIEWIWIAPQMRLADHRFTVGKTENLTTMIDDEMEDAFNSKLGRTLERVGSKDAGASVLNVNSAVYWANRASSGKMWIPFTGGHLAQAGVGIELVFTDATGNIVAKLRHSGREGDELEDAAEELIDDIRQFVQAH